MKECAFEKDAPAMNLVQHESVEFVVSAYGDFKLVTETVYRIKIFNKEGFKHASIIIPYTGRTRTSRIVDVEGSTYNLDNSGNIVATKIDKKDIFRDKNTEKNGLSTVRFTFPEIKAGSVIEYRYKRIEKNSYFIAPWFFQGDIPTLSSSCKITFPSFSTLEKRVIALDEVEEYPEDNKLSMRKTSSNTFVMHNIKSFKEEPFMSSLKDNLQRIEFGLVPATAFFNILATTDSKWSEINSLLLRAPFFGKQFNISIPGTEAFIDSVKHIDSIAGKVNAVYQYVKKNMTWDKHYTFFADDIATVWNEKQGSSAEINIIILNLLRKAGVDCYPIIFSTRENGKADVNFPNAGQFNNVDVLIINKDNFYILDGAERDISFTVPPLNILNRNALIIDRQNSKWVNIVDPRPLIKDSAVITANLNNNGLLEGEAVITYYDLSRAVKITQDNTDTKEDEQEYLLSDAPDIHIDTTYLLNKEDELKPLKQVMKFHYELPATGEFYFLNPFLFSTFKKNQFTDSTRRTDIDFGANASFNVHMEIKLPEDITVEELTRNKVIRTPDTVLYFARLNTLEENKITINSKFDINRSIFTKDDYTALADFFHNLYGILNEQVLLKKKTAQ